MATRPYPEPLNGGLVTARDPALLEPGELTVANNAIYMPNDPAIHKVKGRTKYNTVAMGAAGNVKGLRFLEFDGGASLLAAHEDDDIFLSTFSAETGTFASITPLSTVGSGTTLDAIHHEDRYVLVYGAGENKVVRADGTARRQGLNPVGTMDTVPTLGSGVWNSQLGIGFYHFLTTEVMKDTVTGEEVESGFVGVPRTTASGLTTPASQAITITQPTVVNSGLATHWRIYMAGPTVAEVPIPPYAIFKMVAEVAIETTTYVVGNQAGIAGRFPGTVSDVSWTNETNVTSDNNTGATTSSDGATLLATNFGFSGLSGTIQGFEVFIKFKVTGYTPLLDRPLLRVDLTHNGTNFYPGNNSRYFLPTAIQGATANYVVATLGNQSDLWGRTGSPAWALADVNANANFGVRLTYGTAVDLPAGGLPTINVDFVKIAVHTTGSAQPVNLDGKPFRTVNVSVAGITTSHSADGPPPVSTTGDMFEGQLVLNDIQDQSIIRYSLPGYIESFPSIYFMNFESKTQDSVTLIRRLGNKLIVGLKQQLYRVNYLPRETDAEFDRGRAYEAISETEGIVSSQAAALFSPDGGPLFLAYISHKGPRYTDGFQTMSLSDDLDWANTVRLPVAGDIVNYLANAVFVNYPLNQQLWLYYTIAGQTTNTKALVFHYNKAHRKEGGTFKVTGPIDVAAISATTGRLAGNDVLLTGQSGGFVYVEDRAYTHNAGGTIPFSVRTREMYPFAPSQSGTVESLFVRHMQNATSTVTVTPYTRFKNDAQVTQATKTFTTAQAGLARLVPRHNFESIQWGFTEPGADGGVGVRLGGLTMDLASTGLPERTT